MAFADGQAEPSRCPGCFRELSEPGPCPGCGYGGALAEDPAPDVAAPPESSPPPLADDVLPLPGEPRGPLPPAPSGGYQTDPQAKPPPRPELPRVLIWLLLFLIVGVYVGVGGSWDSAPLSALDARGLLHPQVLDDLPRDGWRLIHATFVHRLFYVLLISVFLVWFLGGEVEQRAGGGLVLLVCVVLGGGLNAVRVALEPAASLKTFSGAWPAGLALAGVALSLVVRRGESKLRVLSLLVFELALLGFLAYIANLLSWQLVTVAGVSLGAGCVVGALWPQGPGRAPTGCLVGVVAIGVLGLAEAARHLEQGQRRSRPPWETPPAVRLDVELKPVDLQPLKVRVDLPVGWKEHPQPRTGTCPQCREKVSFPPRKHAELAQVEQPETKQCPKCEAEVWPSRFNQVLFAESTLFSQPRRVQVMSWPRGPFDAPDTLLGDRQLGQPTLQQSVPEEEGFFGEETGPMGRGYRVTSRGQLRGKPFLMHLYMYVGKRRAVFLRCLAPDPGSPQDRELNGAVFDAIARSIRPLPRKPRAPKKTEKTQTKTETKSD